MPYRAITLILLFIFIPGMIWSHIRQSQADARQAVDAAVRDMAGPQQSLSQSLIPIPHYIILSDKGTPEGYILFSGDLADDIKGYGGHIPLVLKINLTGEIKEIRVLAHNETPSYVGDLDYYSRQFIGKTSSVPIEIGKDIDTISRATITSDAMARTVNKCLTTFSEKILGHGHQSRANTRLFPWSHVLGALIVFGFGLVAILTADKLLRWLAMFAGFTYFGIITATMLSVVQVTNIGLLNIPDFISNPLWWLILAFAFISALTVGRAWCATACPFILPQEILYNLNRRSKRPRPPDEKTDRAARYLKYIFLMLILAGTFILNDSSPANVEPFVTLFRGHATKLAWAFLILCLICSIFYFRFWCVFLCPVGALTGLLSRIALFKISTGSGCTTCGQCVTVCPTSAVSKPDGKTPEVDPAECILCGKCIKSCPEKRLSLRTSYEKK